MGPVFRGDDGETRQRVVIKVIRVGLTPDNVTRVAAALAALRDGWPAHPGLVPLLDTGVVDVEPYVVTPWVDGDSLDVALREYGPAHITDAVPRLRRLAEALDSAAAAGIAHGSLHLRDVIVSVEQTVLTGLGVAQVLERVGVRPPVRRPYCAPEVAAGGPIAPAADLYALAAIAGEWLSGRRVPAAGTAPRLPAASPEGAAALAAIVSRALDDSPDARFPSCTAFVAALTERLDDAAPRPSRSAVRRPVAADAPRLLFDDAAPAAAVAGQDPVVDVGPPDIATSYSARPGAVGGAAIAGVDPADARVSLDDRPLDDDDLAGAATMTLASGETGVDDPWDTPAPDAATPGGSPGNEDAEDDAGRDVAEAPPAEARSVDRIAYRDPAPALTFDDEPTSAFDGEAARDDRETPSHAVSTPVATLAGVIVLLVFGALAGGWLLLRWGTPSAPRVAATAATPVPVAAPAPVNAASPPAAAATPATDGAPRRPTASAAAPAASAPAAIRATPPQVPARPAPATRRPEAKTTQPSRPATPPGRLLVRTTPAGAEVFVNGERRGVTPLTVRGLALGTYTLRLVHGGYTPSEQRVVLNAGRPARSLVVPLTRVRAAAAPPAPQRPTPSPAASSAPGSLLVDSRPGGARVFVDGREVGVTPVTVPALAAGAHTVRIERAGYDPVSTTARIEARTRARVAVTLTAERPQ